MNRQNKHQNKHQNKLISGAESLIYSAAQMFLGLLLHPYRSMQLLVKNKILLPFIFYPFLLGCFFILSLRIELFAWFHQNYFIFKFCWQVLLFFCFYWQVVLFYLWIRFARAFA